MSGKRFWVAILVVVALAGALAAQEEKNEVSGVFGRTYISTQPIQPSACPGCFDPNIRFGRGLTIEGSYARRFLVAPIFAIAAEVPVLYNPDEDLHAGGSSPVPKDYSALFVAPGARVNLFPTTAVSLWGSLGAGFEHVSQSGSTLFGAVNLGKGTTSGVLQYGVGLDVRFLSRAFLRVEGRDYWAGEPDFPQATTGKSRIHNYFVGGGVMWRF
jgi:hypothetical protein